LFDCLNGKRAIAIKIPDEVKLGRVKEQRGDGCRCSRTKYFEKKTDSTTRYHEMNMYHFLFDLKLSSSSFSEPGRSACLGE
jgi:hypothetical protein